MKTTKQLKKLIAKEEKAEAKRRKTQIQIEERARLKKQLFNLKHRKKIKFIKNIGKTIKVSSKNLSKSFSKQRKSKKGLGGFLQRVADNQ